MFTISATGYVESVHLDMTDIRAGLEREGYSGEALDAQAETTKIENNIRAGLAKMGPVVGFKPIGKVDDLFGIRIPNDDLTIRIWPGNTAPDTGVFYLDFINTASGKAVNKPPGYILDVIAPAGLASRMVSVEEAWDGKPAAEGEERFVLLEQLTIKLTRPGYPDFVCVLPRRTRPGELHFARM